MLKIFLLDLLFFSLVLGSDDVSLSRDRVKRNAGFGSNECQTATRVEKYNCVNDACRKWSCYSGTTTSFCRKTWEEMDCIIALYNKKCNAADQQSLKDYYNSIQKQYESGRCKEYPRNETSYTHTIDSTSKTTEFSTETQKHSTKRLTTDLPQTSLRSNVSTDRSTTENTVEANNSNMLAFTGISIVSQECYIRVINEQEKCFVNACKNWNCYDSHTRQECKAMGYFSCRDIQTLCLTVWTAADCVSALVNEECSTNDQKRLNAYLMKNQAEYESNECADYPKTSSNHY